MRLAVALALTVLACSCVGPKSDCQGSMESFFKVIAGKKWSAGYAMLTPEHQKKVGSEEKFTTAMDGVWAITTDHKLAVNQVIEAGTRCEASGFLSYTVVLKNKGEDNVDITDEYFSWTLKKLDDGKWYMEMPGMEKLPSY